jgi:hypothetical protein
MGIEDLWSKRMMIRRPKSEPLFAPLSTHLSIKRVTSNHSLYDGPPVIGIKERWRERDQMLQHSGTHTLTLPNAFKNEEAYQNFILLDWR